MEWPKFVFPRIKLPIRIAVPKVPVPKITLPKINIPKPTLPKFSTAGLTIKNKLRAVGNVLANTLTPFEKQLSKLSNLVSKTSPIAIKDFVKNAVRSGADTITGLVEKSVNGAIAGAIGTVNLALNIAANQVTYVADLLAKASNSVTNAFAASREEVDKMLADEIELKRQQKVESTVTSIIVGTISKNASSTVKALSNNELKALSESSTLKAAAVEQYTSTVIQKSAEDIAKYLISMDMTAQPIVIDKLESIEK